MKNYYLFIASIVFICGEILTSLKFFKEIQNLPPYFVVTLIGILFALMILARKRDAAFLALLLVLVFLLGALRYYVFNKTDETHIKNYSYPPQKKVIVKGNIVSDPSVILKEPSSEPEKGSAGSRLRRKESFVLKADSIKIENQWEKTDGLTLVNIRQAGKNAFQYGDIVLAEGSLRKPFSYGRGRFDYGKYLANKRIYSVLNVKSDDFLKVIGEDKTSPARFMRFLYALRTKLRTHIQNFLEPPYSHILVAALLGERQNIPRDIQDAFLETGTLHILAISGMHIGVIYFALRLLLKVLKTPHYLLVFISVLFLWGFTIIAGGSASILRSTTMFSILAFGEMLKRKISVYNLIGLSLFIILIVSPNQLFDAGFILSYAAIFSLFTVWPIFQIPAVSPENNPENIFWRKTKYYLLNSVLMSFAVWLGLLPILAYYFGVVTPVIVIANIIAVPLFSFIMGAGMLFVSVGFISHLFAVIFSQSAWFFLFALVKSIKFLKNIPLAHFTIRPPRLSLIIFYYAALILVLRLVKIRKQKFHQNLT